MRYMVNNRTFYLLNNDVVFVYMKVTLGGTENFHDMKNEKRSEHDLPMLDEDPQEVCKQMRASSPPASAADLIEQQQAPRRSLRGPKKVKALL